MHLQGIPCSHGKILVVRGGKTLIGSLGKAGILPDDRGSEILGVWILLEDMTGFGIELQTFERIARLVERIAPDKEKAGDEVVVPFELKAGSERRIVLHEFEPAAKTNRQVPVCRIAKTRFRPPITLIVKTRLLVFLVVGGDLELIELRAD